MRVDGLPLEPRERGHAAAIGAFAAGRWKQASRILDQLTAEHPRDALALQAGHPVDLHRGDAAGLRSRAERALPHWQQGDPGYHAPLGMLAFGCEESNFDGPIHGQRSAVTVDLIDASSLLRRLQLRGVDVRERWQSVADLWRQVAEPGLYAFNDLQAAMAWIGSGDRERSAHWIAAQSGQDPAVTGDGAAIAAALGGPLLRGFEAWARGNHPQRQVITLTLEAARRDAKRAAEPETVGQGQPQGAGCGRCCRSSCRPSSAWRV